MALFLPANLDQFYPRLSWNSWIASFSLRFVMSFIWTDKMQFLHLVTCIIYRSYTPKVCYWSILLSHNWLQIYESKIIFFLFPLIWGPVGPQYSFQKAITNPYLWQFNVKRSNFWKYFNDILYQCLKNWKSTFPGYSRVCT